MLTTLNVPLRIVLMAFKDALATALSEAGITNSELARKVNVHRSTVTGWLQGRSEPRGAQFSRLIKALPSLGGVFDEEVA